MKNMLTKLREHLIEMVQCVQYQVLNEKYTFPLPRTIKFDTEIDKEHQTLLINSTDYPGLYAIAPLGNQAEIINSVNDAIFTYFDVPRYIARRTENQFFPPKTMTLPHTSRLNHHTEL